MTRTPPHAAAAGQIAAERFDELRLVLNRTTFLGLFEWEDTSPATRQDTIDPHRTARGHARDVPR